MRRIAELPLVGPAGEPVDLRRTIASHGLADLPPMRFDEKAWTLEVTVPVDGHRARTIRLQQARVGCAALDASGRKPGARETAELVAQTRWLLRLDDDLSTFYAQAAADPALAWVTSGAGRLVRSPTVFEEVVKTICTTNCSWSATERMVGAIVEHLGIRAPTAPPTGPLGRAFPSPATMAEAGSDFYRDVARAGYRGPYLRNLATSVAEGSLNLEELAVAGPDEIPDDEVEARLLALPGVGPYAAAHVMLLLGRTSRCVLDSWSRPKYARVIGRRSVTDAAIVRRFRRYGPYAGLAFWLAITRDWVPD
jgi:3-methyladenine DNA glycosylase/8-oxoguanine DNA glycosylase